MDFVNYSIGKKLQEKGYPHGYNRFGYRPIYSDECTIRYLWDTGAYDEEYYGENIPCPTINEVLKWLRVEKKILITIIPQEKNLGHDTLCFAIYRITEDLYQPIYNGTVNTLVDSYEYISLAGIEYVLDNLI
jgi:hypothetical protein